MITKNRLTVEKRQIEQDLQSLIRNCLQATANTQFEQFLMKTVSLDAAMNTFVSFSSSIWTCSEKSNNINSHRLQFRISKGCPLISEVHFRRLVSQLSFQSYSYQRILLYLCFIDFTPYQSFHVYCVSISYLRYSSLDENEVPSVAKNIVPVFFKCKI